MSTRRMSSIPRRDVPFLPYDLHPQIEMFFLSFWLMTRHDGRVLCGRTKPEFFESILKRSHFGKEMEGSRRVLNPFVVIPTDGPWGHLSPPRKVNDVNVNQKSGIKHPLFGVNFWCCKFLIAVIGRTSPNGVLVKKERDEKEGISWKTDFQLKIKPSNKTLQYQINLSNEISDSFFLFELQRRVSHFFSFFSRKGVFYLFLKAGD